MSGGPRFALRTRAAALALGLLAACSSTTAAKSDRVAAPGSSPVVPTAPGTVATSAPGLGAPGTVPSGTAPGQAGTAAPSQPRAGGAPAPGLGPPGRGVSATAIKVGFWIVDVSGTCSTLGVSGNPACEESDEGEIEAINTWINAHGGIAGRKLDPVVIKSDVERSGYAAEAEAACEAFTEDHKVFVVVVPPQISRPEFVSCLAARNTPVVDGGFWPFDRRDWQRLAGILYMPNRPRPERWVAAYIDGLAAQGFFGKGTKVGLLRFEGAPFRRVTEGVLKPRLAAHGVRLTDEFAITPPQNTSSEYGTMNAQLNSAVLRFNDKDVDRVIFFGTLLEMQFFFMHSAEAQGFRPRYGLSSLDWPSFLEGLAPRDQLRGAVGVGWSIGYDVAAARDPGPNAAATRCKKILQDAGLDPGAGRNAKCDSAFFLKAALDRAPALNLMGLRLAVEGMGRSFEPAETFAAQFGPSRYDGPASFRYVRFDDGCACFRYSGGLRPLP